MIWFVLIATALIIGVSVLFAMAKTNSAKAPKRRLTNEEKVNMAKVAGVMPNRKEN